MANIQGAASIGVNMVSVFLVGSKLFLVYVLYPL